MLMSWNILAPSLVEDKNQQEWMSWGNRVNAIIKCIKDVNPDYLFLQEVPLDSFELDFAELLVAGNYQHARHIPNKNRTLEFGNVTLWKTGKLVKVVQKSRVLHVTLLFNGVPVTLANAHLPAGNGETGYEMRLLHLKSCAAIWKDDLHVVFGGDLNDSVWNPFGIAFDLRNLGFFVDETTKATCYSKRSGFLHNLDHVMSRSADITMTFYPLYTNIKPSDLPLPNLPSDHLPVCYKLTCHSSNSVSSGNIQLLSITKPSTSPDLS